MNESRLQISDLMVGDLMKVAKNVCVEKGAIVRILGMDSTITLPHKELIGCVLFVQSNDIDEIVHGVYIDAIEPIPLTPEILEKNGFKPYIPENHLETVYACQDVSKAVADELYALWPYQDGSFYLLLRVNGKDMVRIDVRYMHQLQHALRLCGIEKEIIL